MIRLKNTLATALAVVVLATAAATAQAGHGSVEGLSISLLRQASDLQRATQDRFRYTRQFRHLSNESLDLCRRVTDLLRFARIGATDRLHDELEEFEERLEHFQRDVNRAKAYSAPRYGYESHSGRQNFRFGSVDRILDNMFQTIRNLHQAERFINTPLPAPQPIYPAYRRPTVSVGYGGVSFNGRGFSFSFGR